MKKPQEKKFQEYDACEIILPGNALQCLWAEHVLLCSVKLSFWSYFPKHIVGDSREHSSAIGGREEHRLSLWFEVNYE